MNYRGKDFANLEGIFTKQTALKSFDRKRLVDVICSACIYYDPCLFFKISTEWMDFKNVICINTQIIIKD